MGLIQSNIWAVLFVSRVSLVNFIESTSGVVRGRDTFFLSEFDSLIYLPLWLVPGQIIIMIIITAGRKLQEMQESRNDIRRIDPLDHFRRYRGPYDITNKHYWSSTIFTGIYGYAIGLLWLFAGAVYSMYLCMSCCFRNKKGKLKKIVPCQKQCYLFPLALATVFVILAIIASGIALGGIAQFQSRAKTIMGVITNTADQASNTMYNTTGAMRKMSIILKESGSSDGNQAANYLASTSDKLSYEATGIARQAQKNRNLSEKVLTIMYILTSTIICLSLASVIALTVFGVLRFQRVVYMLVTICWLLTVLCWLLFGTYFFIERFTSDTCTALHNFQQNPDNSLSIILPCDELRSDRTILTYVSFGLYQVINQVNRNISVLRANSLRSLRYVCNPFSGPPNFLYQPEACPANSIHIGDFPKELKMFTCSDTDGEKCEKGFVTASEYNAIEAYTNPVQNLLDSYPKMEDLVNCQLVKGVFSDILAHHCKPVQKQVKTICISVLLLSIEIMILVTIWSSTTHHEQQHFADGSVRPNISTIEESNVDPQADIEVNNQLAESSYPSLDTLTKQKPGKIT